MTKGKAFVLGIVLLTIATGCFYYAQYLFMMLFGVPAVVYVWLYVHKDERDKEFIAQAQQEREASLRSQPQPELPPMTSRSSRQLFVPSPLHEHNKEMM